MGVGEDDAGLVEAALPVGLGGVADEESVGWDAGGDEHGAGEGEEVGPVGDDGDEVVLGRGLLEDGHPGREPGGGGGDLERDELNAGGEGRADEVGLAGAAEGDGGGEGGGVGAVCGGGFADGEGGGGADFGEEDLAELGVGVDEQEVVGGVGRLASGRRGRGRKARGV